MKRLLVGTDGSVNGQAAVRWAVDIARATGSDLVVATALKVLHHSGLPVVLVPPTA
jgi:nucleotide-binding universal stress UspA family protein